MTRIDSTASDKTCGCHLPRRGFITGLLAASTFGGIGGLAAGCAQPGASSAAVSTARDRIDIHHHCFSPAYVAELDKVGQAPPVVKSWTVARTLDDMDKAGVATAMLSVTTPQVSFASAADARRMARESNEWTAQLAQTHKGRFGVFAMLPMQDMDSALREAAYALDVLKADGIGLLTSYGDKWLGHADFAPLMDELNRRGAILYTHPTAANCCRNVLPDVPPTVIEFGTDTTRAITNIVFSGTAARTPDLRYIFSHAGGTLPFLTERLLRMPLQDAKLNARVPRGVLFELRRFFYDTAWSAHPSALAALTRLVDSSQVLLGSDYPYRSGEDNVKGLLDHGFAAADLQAITRGNALRLMPRWRT